MLGEVQNATRAVLKDLESNTSAKLFHFNEFYLRLFYSTESQQTTIFFAKTWIDIFQQFSLQKLHSIFERNKINVSTFESRRREGEGR